MTTATYALAIAVVLALSLAAVALMTACATYIVIGADGGATAPRQVLVAAVWLSPLLLGVLAVWWLGKGAA